MKGDKFRKKDQGLKDLQQKTNKFKLDNLNFSKCALAGYQLLFILFYFQNLLFHFSPCLYFIHSLRSALTSLPYTSSWREPSLSPQIQ